MNKLNYDFFNRDILIVAEELIGKNLVYKNNKYIVSELEIYRGEEDTACHASRGITKRTEVLYDKAGTIYVYLCYGIHNMLNIVTGKEGQPQAILIRGLDNIYGPGKITKQLGIDRSLNKKTVFNSDLYFEENTRKFLFHRNKRIGINYADEIDKNRLWNFKIEEKELNYG
ncbi:DNA-3-methyladenine glycosylase [Miniphocaeibacter halophilus]|uniref:DNA-3-methyladenine glycosylase n=1 Tax=Miniphocaeibacter halophilus TaxID=2931922 RepID=A0AC61MPZ3_9FIRM|nr:DNA-3-methyladenine glycosylase [Miniphocaeibacter halophilus]QQK07662.1 DNA-3-methyladenine glycosylase [Miniphocaeibacter halophilus]